MKEGKKVVLFTALLFILGLASLYLICTLSDFNFYKAELNLEGGSVNERLFYLPDKDYHTLFRNFDSLISVTRLNSKNYIEMISINCSSGKAYVREQSGEIYSFPEKTPVNLTYTENNEYGCSFGAETGFKKKTEYISEANYQLHPKNLIEVNGKYYIKFIAYSKERHTILIKDKNFIIKGEAVPKKYYLPFEEVVVYLPYTSEDYSNFEIIKQADFDFGTKPLWILAVILFLLFPAGLFFGIWHLFGRETSYEDVPEQLSNYPRERKGWEIASYFNPPFSRIDKDFFSAMLLDLYNRKNLDLIVKEKDVYVKITNSKNIDRIEEKFMKLLKLLKSKASKESIDGEYLNLNKSLKEGKITKLLALEYSSLQKSIESEGKKYMENKSHLILSIALIAWVVIGFGVLIKSSPWIILFEIAVSVIFIVTINYSALLMRFKGEYYKEYQQWQAFKNYLSDSIAMKESPYRGVVLWNHYLVYASGLGVAKEVIKQLKQRNIIGEEKYYLYNRVGYVSNSFVSAGASNGAGGHGGFSGGGIGGGGGGGR